MSCDKSSEGTKPDQTDIWEGDRSDDHHNQEEIQRHSSSAEAKHV